MSDFLPWLIVLEILGVAFLPVTVFLFRWLPDRGYIFAKILGLLLLTFVIWLLGNLLPIVGPPFVAAIVLLILAAISWWLWRDEAIEAVRTVRSSIIIEECLFVLALLIWTVMRATVFHPGIQHTEQYMDLTFLQGSLRSSSYPPYDAWMSGHSINYYYFGYLMFATLTKLSGVAPAIGYNLALSTVFAFTIGGAYSVAYALSRSRLWAPLGPVFVALLGNWHAALVQLPAGHDPSTYFWFWDSTRVLGGVDNITEFPFFSLMLGDLHPHVMALPVTIMVIALGIALVSNPATVKLGRDPAVAGRLLLIGICVGSLYAINSWDFPAYILLIATCLVANAYLTDATTAWWRAPLRSIPAMAIASIVAFLPYSLRYKSPAHGLGWVTTPSNLGQFLQIFGLFLLVAAVLLITYGIILRPAEEVNTPDEVDAANRRDSALEAGAGRSGDTFLLLASASAVLFVIGLRYQQWTLVLLLAFAGAAGMLLQRVMNTEEPNRADTLALILLCLGCLVLAGTEVVYLKDEFDGGPNYRMNTVFKFYYQGWTLLGLAAAYGAYRALGLLRRHFGLFPATLSALLVALGIGASATYTFAAPQSANLGGLATNLDGVSAFRALHPSDASAIDWLSSHVSGNPVVLEAGNGGDYQFDYARVSAFSGLPTVMGWAGHEYQWRGNDPDIARRVTDVTTIYSTTNDALAKHLLRRYNVRYVFAGDTERLIPGAHLTKFGTFMHVAFRDAGTTVYTW